MGSTDKNPLIVLRHGLLSEADVLEPLAKYIYNQTQIPVRNVSYDWKRSVLRNGVELADQLMGENPGRPLILVGHSMGGLICRVANILLSLSDSASNVQMHATHLGYTRDVDAVRQLGHKLAERRASGLPLPKVKGLVTLATPNSGAITRSQTASLANLAGLLTGLPLPNMVGITRILHYGISMRWESVQDLTSDRLFRLLQHFEVETPVHTISGSKGNQLTGSGAVGGVVKLAGIQLDMPHDQVVEDQSVNLTQSILPNEFKPELCHHHRAYEDCIDVHHCNIYDHWIVREEVCKIVRSLSAPTRSPTPPPANVGRPFGPDEAV